MPLSHVLVLAQLLVPLLPGVSVTAAADNTAMGVTVSFSVSKGKSQLKTATWAAKQNSAPSATEQAAHPRLPAASWCTF